MKKLWVIICGAILAFAVHSRNICASQTVYARNLTIEDVRAAVMSGSLGWIRVQSGIIATSDIDLKTIKIIDLHQDGNTAFVYCNFTHKQGENFFGYIPLLRLRDTPTWINRDNGIILEK